RVTFNGVETVTVPAGSFQACKFTHEDGERVGGQINYTSSSTNWLAVGSGVPVRHENSEGVMELTRGQINGNVIGGN
ncbi:MAG: hypothetical protein WCY32_15235, partial [Burkholderiaceae bacterium]